MPRYAILAIGAFDYIYSKTGNMLIRYRSEEVVVVIDPEQAGKTADKVLGWGGDIPCVASFSDAKYFSPTHLVIGSAPPGGNLDDANRKEIREAVQNGCHIINGMHVFLNDDSELSQQAKKNNVAVIIAGAGGSAQLPGMISSLTSIPVLGVPIESKKLKGLDSLLSIAQMPKGIPVGSLAIGEDGAINAGLLAASIIANNNPVVKKNLKNFRANQTKSVKKIPK